MNYARPLRAIGQALATLKVENFSMEPEGECFLVRGHAPLATRAAESSFEEKTIHHIWGLLPGQRMSETGLVQSNRRAMRRLDLRYSPKDIVRLEQKGRAQRNPAHGIPDRANLAQLLRTLGEYLNQKRARLLRLSRHEQFVTVEFETAAGERRAERLPVAGLHDLWIEMCLKRAGRTLH
ncbi:MAG TPA: hypothetical protein VFU31_17215 [Candidatus Binatia bacterium]|nr:hypothetical protein [Candidatus Binatia bacterium]